MTAWIRKMVSVIAALMALTGCGGDGGSSDVGDAKGAAADSTMLRIAVMPTLDCLPIYVAYETGIFERESLSVSLIPFTSHMDCDTAIAGGSVHVMPTDLVRAERLIHKGTPLRYFTTTGLGWQLLTAKTARIRKLEQLDDKMLAMTRYSATAMLADQLVDSAKLQTERVFRIQVNDVLVRLNMMETGTMDAMFLTEPQATVARQLGCNLLYDTEADSIAMGAIAYRQDTIRQTSSNFKMETFIKAYNEACDSINTRGLDYYRDLITSRCQVQHDIVDSLMLQHPLRYVHVSPPRQRDIDRAKTWLGLLSPAKSPAKNESKKGNKKKKQQK